MNYLELVKTKLFWGGANYMTKYLPESMGWIVWE